jgi:L-methionine (R)-S-oxide reductase
MYTPHEESQRWLEAFVSDHQGVAGSVHVERDGDLYLTAAKNLPPPVVATVTHVARGKGMAGVAQLSREPTQTCNLQTDDSGRIKPGAKAVAAQAAIALPVLDPGGRLVAVVGVAFAAEGELPPAQVQALMAAAATVPRSG